RILLLLLLISQSAFAQSDKKTPVSLIYEAIAATNATLWLAEDARLFEKYGLDAKVVNARGAVPVQALVSGSVEFGAFSGSSAIAAVLAGSDIVLVAAKGNFAVMSFWVRRDSPVKSLADLRGKIIGVTRAGSATHMIARLALKSAGLNEREVKFLHHGGLPESFASLDKGIVDAAMGSPPRPGFKELVDLSALKIPFLQGAIEVKRSFLQNRRDIVVSLLKAYLETIKLAKQKPELAIAAISKRMRVPVEMVKPVYQPHENVLEEIPYVRRDSVQVILDQYPKEQLKGLSYEKLVDNSLLQQLEDSGFIKSLYRK
ncbi:MAG TPA: ABC transporter substrate-binding protein, partial [Candidatus Binatia bacterium]|nr:ABC transporter substrate-binding protein [Candidatus Binatia bacterium]